MFRDITIGQYYNVKSPLHSLDPRTKLVSLLCLMVAVFMINSPIEYAVGGVFTLVCIFLSRVPIGFVLKGLKPVWLLVVFTAVINLLFGSGDTILYKWHFIVIRQEAIELTVSMFIRVVLLVTLSSILTLTTAPMELTVGIEKLLKPLEKIKFPSHEVAMMMSIALRFIPTLTDEAEKIMKAQSSRGNDFEEGGIIKKAGAMIPLFIPLFISAFRRADDLAMAMECRCYHGGEDRTSFKRLKMTPWDIVAFIVVIGILGAVIALRVIGV